MYLRLTGLEILVTSLDRRIQPPQAIEHLMYINAGLDESTRAGPEELEDQPLANLVARLVKDREIPLESCVMPYCLANPPTNISELNRVLLVHGVV